MDKHPKRGLSGGTIAVIVLTAIILTAYAIVIPSMTGHRSVTADLGKLAVAVDSSIVRIAATAQVKSMSAQKMSAPSDAKAAPVITPVASPSPTPVPKLRFTLSAAGSVHMNNDALKAMTSKDSSHLDWLFDDLSGAMKADLSVIILENTVNAEEKTGNRNMPAELLTSIAQMGVNTICNGYEDILSAGMKGLAATKSAVLQAGMTPFGVFSSQEERYAPAIVKAGDVKVALLHFQDSISSTGKKKTTVEERSIALSPLTQDVMSSEISAAKASGAQVILVSLCWGKPEAAEPTAQQREIAQFLADAGADIILGAHSDSVQTVEFLSGNREDGKYHPVLCAYSLGNLLSSDREKRYALAGMILSASLEFNPADGCISFLSCHYQPTYSWRGKYEGATRYRVLKNDGGTFADYIDSKQQSVMAACYQMIEKVMANTVIPSIYQ